MTRCFWIGVTDDDLRPIDERAAAAVEGSAAGVRRAAEAAAIPFERILETAGSPWADRKR